MLSQNFKQLIGAVALIGAAAVNVDAQAAVVSATSQITGVTSSLLSFSNDVYLQDVYAYGGTGSAQTGTNIGSSATPLSVTSGSTFADASPSFDLPYAFAGVNGGNGGEAYSTSSWDFDFTATGSGTATVDFEFLSSLDVHDYLPGERAQGSSFLEVRVSGTNIASSYFRFFNDENGFADALFQNLNLSFAVTAGQTGSISVIASSSALAAPVPVPAAAWLLGSALAGIASVARRRK